MQLYTIYLYSVNAGENVAKVKQNGRDSSFIQCLSYVYLANDIQMCTWEHHLTSFANLLKNLPANIFHCVIYMQFY